VEAFVPTTTIKLLLYSCIMYQLQQSNIFLYYVLPFYYSGLFGWVVIYDLVVYLFH